MPSDSGDAQCKTDSDQSDTSGVQEIRILTWIIEVSLILCHWLVVSIIHHYNAAQFITQLQLICAILSCTFLCNCKQTMLTWKNMKCEQE